MSNNAIKLYKPNNSQIKCPEISDTFECCSHKYSCVCLCTHFYIITTKTMNILILTLKSSNAYSRYDILNVIEVCYFKFI